MLADLPALLIEARFMARTNMAVAASRRGEFIASVDARLGAGA